MPGWLARDRTWRFLLAGALIASLLAGALLVGTRAGRGALARGRARVSALRQEARERAAAERLAAEGAEPDLIPDERLPVVEPILLPGGGLGTGWLDYGWSPHDLGPGRAARLDLSGHGGLLLARPGLPGVHGGLLVRFRAPPAYGEFLAVRLEEPGGRHLPTVRLEGTRITPAGGGGSEAWIPIRELNPDSRPVERVALFARREVGTERVEVDEIGLTAAAPLRPRPARPARFAVDCSAPGAPISPLVYGTGTYFVDEGPHEWTVGSTARRWGGNHASRYNWRIHAWNMDSDWFFRNAAVRSAESFLAENRDRGVASALTVPILGWVAKDTSSASFPVSRRGPQQQVAWDTPDAGNGIGPDGRPLPSPLPTTTSVACPPGCVEEWVRSLREAAERGGPAVESFILDNEPMLWSKTHRDVHPDPLGYDELLRRTVDYARAIRRADPAARIAGPAEWGWQNLFLSGKDVAAGGWWRPDRLLHGNVPLLPWYLRRLREHEERTGERLLDVVDVHFYPAADLGIGLGGRVDPATAALRIRSTRALWDPTYVDESWIDEPIRLLPRLREWIQENYPGRGISIGEWNFGAEGHMSGGLATAEALGRFGAAGIHSAYYWTHPADRSPAFWAFRAFRNFDGRGGRFLDLSAPVSGEGKLASLFASRDPEGRRVVLVLLNHSPTSPLEAEIALPGCGPIRESRAFVYAGGQEGFRASSAPEPRGSGLAVNAPPYSMTVLELALGTVPQAGGGP